MLSREGENVKEVETRESAVEGLKRRSGYLRGTVAETLAADAGHFETDDVQVLKFHGVYQRNARGRRSADEQRSAEPEYVFTVRVAIPGGRLTAEQYLALDDLAGRCGNGTLRITTRQCLQYYEVRNAQLKELIAGVNRCGMTTLSGGGDVERNVTAPAAPLADPAYALVRALAVRMARELRPATGAYAEIWLGGDKMDAAQGAEPLYGPQYLPRKLKTGITVAGDDSVDVYTQDCGLIAIVKDGHVAGFNLLVGGGLGMTHSRGDTRATLAQPLGSIEPQYALDAVRTVAAILRDHGNRQDRKHARLKYLVAEWGLEHFREEFRRRAAFELRPPVTLPPAAHRDLLGRHAQGDGRWFYGVFVPNGRMADGDGMHLRTALRELIRRYQPGICLTPDQNLLFADLEEASLDAIERTLRGHGVTPVAELAPVRRYSIACAALPGCPGAVTEAERVLPEVLAQFERELQAFGLGDEPISLRMAGCPNGCARPYTADIGLVGRKAGKRYNIYVGGGLAGQRLADLYAEDVPIEELAAAVRPLLEAFARGCRPGEGFSDFYQRLMGRTAPRTVLTGVEEPSRARLPLQVLP
jgi:sulfite reductase beta subunit-like hemoprotein